MNPQRMDRETLSYLAERRIQESILKGKIMEMSTENSEKNDKSGSIHRSFWRIFKTGITLL